MQITVKQYTVERAVYHCDICKIEKVGVYRAEVVAVSEYKQVTGLLHICKECLEIEKDRVFMLQVLLMPKIVAGSQSSVIIPSGNHNH